MREEEVRGRKEQIKEKESKDEKRERRRGRGKENITVDQ